ncbi:unnamed protein product, partial [Rotaria magnacalcarata]
MNWLFKLQDILPQIITVKHCKGANNTAADYISRHFPPSTSTNINPSTINVTYDDWSIGTKHWDAHVPKPQHTQYTEPSILDNACIHNATQPRSSSENASSASTIAQSRCSSPPMATPLHDFSLSRIRSEQAQDVIIQQIIQQIRNNRRYESFI